MDKSFSPADIESRVYAQWEARGYFTPGGSGAAYSIVIPPPNVTGTLHMGHAFQDTIMDALIRYKRMLGFDTLWQPGTDHAGIATQMVVERQLNAAGQSRIELGRDAFVEKVWQWKDKSGGQIANQMRRLGASVDWQRDRFTMDPGLSQAVTEVFVRLHQEGLIYRGKRLVNWDPVLKTALSDLEVVAEEEMGNLWHLRYPMSDGGGFLIVATTRPETLFGDAAVAVHPDDERYRRLIGRRVRLPLTARELPIIADSYVDPTFGSGCVKITPAHDFNDYEVGQRHGLPLINIMNPDGSLNGEVPAAYRGLDRTVARTRVIADLEALELLGHIEPHRADRAPRRPQQCRPRAAADRSMVRRHQAAGGARDPCRGGGTHPLHSRELVGVYFEWMRKIKDWCISRQLWWGHRIPAWYDPDGRWYVARSEAEARIVHGIDASVPLRQDEDVLDTWFSSALWPFSTQGWPEETRELETYYPTSVLVTGFDIIFFWVARMIMMGLKFTGEVPFREGLRPRADSRPRRTENVQVEGQRHRSPRHRGRNHARRPACQAHLGPDAAPDEARHREGDAQAISPGHRGIRHGCPAPVLRAARHSKPRPAFRHGARRGIPEFLQQTVERRALCPAQCGGRGSRQAGRGIQPGRPMDSVAPGGHAGAGGIRVCRIPPG